MPFYVVLPFPVYSVHTNKHWDTMDQIITGLLNTDYAHRTSHTEHLYPLNDIKCETWDQSLPTLYHNTLERESYGEGKKSYDNSALKKSYLVKYPELNRITFSNILIAGGSVARHVRNKHDPDCDVDMFIYGLDTEQAVIKRVYEIVEALVCAYTPGKYDKAFRITKTMNYVQVDCGSRAYQIIFRGYKAKADVLYGFDIAPSCVGFDGKTFLTTDFGLCAYKYGISPVDIRRQSTSFMSRLDKYFSMFPIVLPELDMSAVWAQWKVFSLYHDTETPIPLSYALITIHEMHTHMPNAMYRVKLYMHKTLQTYAGDYDTGLGDMYTLIRYNVRRIVRKEYEKVKFIFHELKTFQQYCTDQTKLLYTFDIKHFYMQMLPTLKRHPGSVWRRRQWFDETLVKVFMAKWNDHVQQNGAITVPPSLTEILCNDQVALIVKDLHDVTTAMKIRMTNPGAQFTGSFHPQSVTAKEFYGPYYHDKQ